MIGLETICEAVLLQFFIINRTIDLNNEWDVYRIFGIKFD